MTAKDRKDLAGDLTNQARFITMDAFFLYTLSNAYMEVSNKYVLRQLAELDGLSVLENFAERQSAVGRLLAASTVAKTEIIRSTKEKRQQYNATVTAEIARERVQLQQLDVAPENQEPDFTI